MVRRYNIWGIWGVKLTHFPAGLKGGGGMASKRTTFTFRSGAVGWKERLLPEVRKAERKPGFFGM